MNTRLLLPVAAVSLLALAACENRADPPSQPDPDAGMPISTEVPGETEDTIEDELPSPEELERRREEIEQEAQETFESIMEQTQQSGEQLVEFGSNAMQSLSEQVDVAGDAIGNQIDALVAEAEEFRDENLTDEQKLEIVSNIRATTESSARALGQTEAQVRQAGDTAEARARTALGLD